MNSFGDRAFKEVIKIKGQIRKLQSDMTGVLLRTGDEDSDMPVHRGEIT